MNAFDIVLLVLIGLAVTLAVRGLRARRKKGSCCGCSGNCAACQEREGGNP